MKKCILLLLLCVFMPIMAMAKWTGEMTVNGINYSISYDISSEKAWAEVKKGNYVGAIVIPDSIYVIPFPHGVF